MEENINKKNNIQVNALNVGTEKASSKYYSYQNDSTDIIQANTNKFNKNQENSLSSLFEKTPYEIIDGSLFKVTNKKENIFKRKIDFKKGISRNVCYDWSCINRKNWPIKY